MLYQKYDSQAKLLFDHKNGINIEEAIALDAKSGKYWIPLSKAVMPSAASKKCCRELMCTEKCNCLSIKGFGENILVNSLTVINDKKISRSHMNLGQDLDARVDGGRKVF